MNNGNEILLAEVTVRLTSNTTDYKPNIQKLEIEVTEQSKQKHYIVEYLPRNDISALFPHIINTAVNKLSHIIENFHNNKSNNLI